MQAEKHTEQAIKTGKQTTRQTGKKGIWTGKTGRRIDRQDKETNQIDRETNKKDRQGRLLH